MFSGFAAPAVLLALALPAALAVGWVRARRPALRYPSLALVAGLPRGRASEAVWGRALGRAAAVAVLIVACAGPRVPDLSTPVPAAGIALVLVLDVSGSMAEADFPAAAGAVTRLSAAQAAFRAFVAGGDGLPGRPQDRIGLVTFAAVPRTVCPPTFNHAVLLALLDQQKPATGPDAGTNVGDALAEGLARLDAAGDGRKVIVLLSDGEHNASGRTDGPLAPRQAAQIATGLGVPVYAVDCGGDPGPHATDADVRNRTDSQRTLAAVAGLTGGRLFRAADAAGLRAAVAEIDAIERTPADPYRYRRYRDRTPHWAAAGMVLLAAGGALERTRWRVTG